MISMGILHVYLLYQLNSQKWALFTHLVQVWNTVISWRLLLIQSQSFLTSTRLCVSKSSFFPFLPLCRSLSLCMLCLNALARSICILYEMSNCGLYKIFGEFAFKIFNFEEVSELGVFIAIHRFGTKIFTHSLVHNIIQAYYIHNIMKVLTESRIELNFLI